MKTKNNEKKKSKRNGGECVNKDKHIYYNINFSSQPIMVHYTRKEKEISR